MINCLHICLIAVVCSIHVVFKSCYLISVSEGKAIHVLKSGLFNLCWFPKAKLHNSTCLRRTTVSQTASRILDVEKEIPRGEAGLSRYDLCLYY